MGTHGGVPLPNCPQDGCTGLAFAKLDAFGDVEYSDFYRFAVTAHLGGSQSLVQTSDGGFALTARADVLAALLKLDSVGDVEFGRYYPTTRSGFTPNGLIQTNDGGFALAAQGSLIKVDQDGLVPSCEILSSSASRVPVTFNVTSLGDPLLDTNSIFQSLAPNITDVTFEIRPQCPATCGDGFLHSGFEECDDGNTLDRDGCSSICQIEILPVIIDIKPGSFPNSINVKKQGVIPVAILSTNTAQGESFDFDATTVDEVTVRFGLNGAVESHGMRHIEDVDGDGDLDLVLHFETQETGIQCGDTSASLTGRTFAGLFIQGSDSVRTVGGGCK